MDLKGRIFLLTLMMKNGTNISHLNEINITCNYLYAVLTRIYNMTEPIIFVPLIVPPFAIVVALARTPLSSTPNGVCRNTGATRQLDVDFNARAMYR